MTVASVVTRAGVISAALLQERAGAMRRHSDITNLLGQGDGYI